MFSAIAIVLQYFGQFIKVAGFLEFEISDYPAILASFAFGPLSGLIVELIKNLIHCLYTTTAFSGELANFLVNGTFVLTCGYIYKHNKTKKTALVSLLVATVVMTITATLYNYFVLIPLYIQNISPQDKLNLVLTVITPFNFIRAVVLSAVAYITYKPVSRILIKKN